MAKFINIINYVIPMYNNKKSLIYILYTIFSIIAFISFISAESCTPAFFFQQYQNPANITLNGYNYNNSDATATTTCYATIRDPRQDIIINHAAMAFLGNGIFTVDVSGTLNSTGLYSASLSCTDGTYSSAPNFCFKVNPTGSEETTAGSLYYIVIMAFLLFLVGVCIYGFVKFDNLLARVSMIGLSYIFFTATFFVAWRMVEDFTNSAFLTNFFNIIWTILMYASLPLLIGGFVYYFLAITKIKEIQRLMEKGFSMDEAEERYSK